MVSFASTAAAPYDALRLHIIPYMHDSLQVDVQCLDGATYQPHAGWEVNGSAERTVVVAKDFARIAHAAALRVNACELRAVNDAIAAVGGVPASAPAPSQHVAAPAAAPSAAVAPAAGPSGEKRPHDALLACCDCCKVRPSRAGEDFCGECIDSFREMP